MQVAYMLLVHHQPSHLARLIRALNAPWAHFFIHVDKSVDISDFLLKVPEAANVHYLHDRERAFWGGFNVVKATLNLLQASLNEGIDFKYYVLLSGSDYPIKSNSAIYDSLSHSSSQHISISNELLLLFPERVKRYWFNDNLLLNPRVDLYIRSDALAGRILKGLMPQLRRGIQFFLQVLPERQPPCFLHYKGSQWWALTTDCVKYILEFVREHKEYSAFHKYSLLPDEHFFHSIVKASSFSHSLAQYDDGPSLNQEALYYIEWSLPADVPKILVEEDLNNLVSIGALFARKFDEVKSAKLLDSIDRHIKGC